MKDKLVGMSEGLVMQVKQGFESGHNLLVIDPKHIGNGVAKQPLGLELFNVNISFNKMIVMSGGSGMSFQHELMSMALCNGAVIGTLIDTGASYEHTLKGKI